MTRHAHKAYVARVLLKIARIFILSGRIFTLSELVRKTKNVIDIFDGREEHDCYSFQSVIGRDTKRYGKTRVGNIIYQLASILNYNIYARV